MYNYIESSREQVSDLINQAYTVAVKNGRLPAGASGGTVEAPRDPSHGDWASSFAMSAARSLKMSPRAIADEIVKHLNLDNSYFFACEVAGAGYLNFRFSPAWNTAVIKAIVQEGENYGSSDMGKGKKVMVEFVSANPTGPMTIGNARGGVLGDTLAAVLQKSGYDVWREFYVNDAGHQIDVLGQSLEARFLQQLLGEDVVPFPDDGYHGEYVKEFAKTYIERYGDSLKDAGSAERRRALVDFVLPRNIERMRADLARYQIKFDNFFFESELHNGYVQDTLDRLQERGAIYEQDGALWFKATDYGCDKDEVMCKSNGFFTYYLVDIAYHRDKFERRGFDRCIDVFGADHHGHTLRFRAGMQALGINPDGLDFVLMQLVRLTRDGEIVRMSKRTGHAITLGDLLDEISVDAARFFFNMRQSDTALDFDLGLAVKKDSDNPVYYVQYAHARLCSLISRLAAEGYAVPHPDDTDLSLLTVSAERDLIRALAQYPEEIRLAARDLQPYRICRYLIDLAGAYHRFNHDCRVKGVAEPLLLARLCLSQATRDVLRAGLTLLGISAPEQMLREEETP